VKQTIILKCNHYIWGEISVSAPSDLPDEIPTLTPAKKSRFKQERVRFEDEGPEELLDRHDTHISAVLSRIIVCFI